MTQKERIRKAKQLMHDALDILDGVNYDAHGSDHVDSMVEAAKGGVLAGRERDPSRAEHFYTRLRPKRKPSHYSVSGSARLPRVSASCPRWWRASNRPPRRLLNRAQLYIEQNGGI